MVSQVEAILGQICKQVGRELDAFPCFMPKPFMGVSASGCHHNLSLWKGGEEKVNTLGNGDSLPGKGVPTLAYQGAETSSLSLNLTFDTTDNGKPEVVTAAILVIGVGFGTTDFFASFLMAKTVQSVRTVGNVGLIVLGVFVMTRRGGALHQAIQDREQAPLRPEQHRCRCCHDLGEEGGYHYFVMEFVEGKSLRERAQSSRTIRIGTRLLNRGMRGLPLLLPCAISWVVEFGLKLSRSAI